jgi:hypothetical protein
MRSQIIDFHKQQSRCVFPEDRESLAQAITELDLKNGQPVIVLIGGYIQKQHLDITQEAVQVIAEVAQDRRALVLSGGTDMGVMASIGQIRAQHNYDFPLVGITVEKLVTWPKGPRSKHFLWWGQKRGPLEPHYSHFILVPGSQFGDESPWIVDSAAFLSQGHRSVTILLNGGTVARLDIDLSLQTGRPVIALAGTGRYADELANQPDRSGLITVVPADNEPVLVETIQAALSNQAL